jgi:UDP-glucose:(heptosyl)LPS alpha-1,3-glucosyltransferase
MRLRDEHSSLGGEYAVRDGEHSLAIALGIFRLLPRGGREGLCLQIAARLEARGHAVTIMTAEEAPEGPFNVQRIVHPALVAYKPERIRAFAYAFRWATRRGFDRSVAFHAMPADLAVLVDNLFHQPDISLLKRLGPRYRAFVGRERACMAQGSRTRVIGMSQAQMDPFASRYGTEAGRIAVLPPTVDPGCRRPRSPSPTERRRLRTELGVAGDGPVWLWIGLQPPVKGLDRVLEALALALTPEARLLVCGLDETNKKMEPMLRQAERLGIAGRVKCLGFVPYQSDRFHDVLAAADVLVHPARNDTTGTVILEAIVNGLPVVASSVCGYSEHVRKSGAGIVLGEPFDAAVWREAVAAVAKSRDALAEKGIAYGRDPALYAGVARAVDLIEAPLDRPWPSGPGAVQR